MGGRTRAPPLPRLRRPRGRLTQKQRAVSPATIGGPIAGLPASEDSDARERKIAWAQIGAALNITRQSAWERFKEHL